MEAPCKPWTREAILTDEMASFTKSLATPKKNWWEKLKHFVNSCRVDEAHDCCKAAKWNEKFDHASSMRPEKYYRIKKAKNVVLTH